MGAYLSEPVTEKISSDKSSEHLSCGASSMQGWRVSQEDAHNCILDFDDNSALFAVYDGHGGAEVAQYCSLHLPTFIKSIPAYKSGNMGQALEDAFLDFDAILVKPETVEELKEIAGLNNEQSDEEEEINDLCAEAIMPIEDVLAKYRSGNNAPQAPALKRIQDESKPLSPYLRAKRDGKKCNEDDDSEILSKKCEKSDNGDTKNDASGGCSSKEDLVNSGNSSKLVNGDAKSNSKIELGGNEDTGVKGDASAELKDKDGDSSKVNSNDGGAENEDKNAKGDTSAELKVKEGESVNIDSEKSVGNSSAGDSSKGNGGSPNSNCESEKEKKSKGKGKALVISAKQQRKMQLRGARTSALDGSGDSDESDSSDEDVVFPVGAASDSEEDGEELEEDDSEEDEASDEEEEQEDDDVEDGVMATDEEEPGQDSGCTAVLALLRGCELYVANAGDSRCVVSRKGKVIEMSIDHKPEDEVENKRIEKAGGRVTGDGRVNGGLNLSRAIGDHAYKKNKELSAREQMITALPDIRTLTIDPNEDEFMVLACDGIWNSLTSQEVVDFVRERLNGNSDKLSAICEELFTACLSSNTFGDGTGCDNMTCVIVKFKDSISKLGASNKRPASTSSNNDEAEASNQPKKIKTDEEPPAE